MTRAGLCLLALNLVGLALAAGLAGLGTWQVQRRAWKLDLIALVEARIAASPAPPPGRERWPAITAASDEYRRLSLNGSYLAGKTTLVQAVTVLGGGFWVLSPLQTESGLILVNRGFVPSDRRDAAETSLPEGRVAVTGLLRLSEPGGAFLRANDPAADRWYSRDVAAIAQARGLSDVAPYFVDAQASPGQDGLPVAGLTVTSFSNNHLVYAITWYVLAAMVLAALVQANRLSRRGR